MKNYLLLLVFISFSHFSFSQVGEICKWDSDKSAAVVLTFDDWSPGQQPIVPKELKSRGINATFFITTNFVASWNHDWPTVVSTQADGNEIGNHTYSHPHLLAQSTIQLDTQITKAKTIIETHVPLQKVISFAYPFGEGVGSTSKDLEVRALIKSSGHIGARSVSASNYKYNFAATEDDYYKIMTYTMSGSVSIVTFENQLKQIVSGGGLLTYLYHSIDDANNSHGDTWYAQVKQSVLQQQLDTLVSYSDKVWITTFGQAVKYHKERNCATLSLVGTTGTTMTLSLTDTLSNNALYNQPLSLKIFRNGVNYSTVTQNGVPLEIDGVVNDSIVFHAIPDGGEIILTVGNLSTETLQLTSEDFRIYQLPGSSVANVHVLKPQANSCLSVIDLSGREIYSLENLEMANDFQIDLSANGNGIYFLRFNNNNNSFVKRFAIVN
ncbi:MAG: polysaccharide deacetylase family protein [Bacteroidetes bacterium]|nr:polysaccharide deacetylase family protein [Bacteroidota bacterium]